MACRLGRAALAKLLLEAGADPAAADASGRTPLHVALLANSDACVTLLLRDRNTNLNAKTVPPLVSGATGTGATTALVPARSLRSSSTRAQAQASERRAREQTPDELDDEADAACGVGLSPLMVAVKCACDVELVRRLLAADADVNLQDALGTPRCRRLHFCFRFHFRSRSAPKTRSRSCVQVAPLCIGRPPSTTGLPSTCSRNLVPAATYRTIRCAESLPMPNVYEIHTSILLSLGRDAVACGVPRR